MKSEKLIRAWDSSLPPEETRLGILYAVLRENRATSTPERSRTKKKRPILRVILVTAAIVAILAALTVGGYAAVKKWALPDPVPYQPTENGNVDIHDTVVYHEEDLESESEHDPFKPDDEPGKPTDADLIRKAVELLTTLGMEDVKSEEMTVTHQTKLNYPREETEILFTRDDMRTHVTYNSETGKFLKLDGFEAAMRPGEEVSDPAGLARAFYEKLPVEQGYALTPGVEKYDDDLWMYEFCREVEPGLYNYYEMVRITVNPETGRLVMVNVFYFPLLDDHGEDEPLSEEEAVSRAEEALDLSHQTLVEAKRLIVLPNWWWSEVSAPDLEYAKVTRWAWVLRYQTENSWYDWDNEVFVDLYTGEIIGGNSIG